MQLNSRYNFVERLLNKYISKEASKAEEKVLDGFFDNAFKKAEWDEARLGEKTNIQKRLKASINKKIKSSKQNYAWIKYTAVASVLILALILYFPSKKTASPIEFATINTIDSLLLPDNSKIILSPHSKVVYQTDYNHKNREIVLTKGNAFFQVTKNKEKPFIVTSKMIKTTVLGTSFNVDLNTEDIIVKVKTGRVKVASFDKQEILNPNECVAYSINSKTFKKETFKDMLAWYSKNVMLEAVTVKDLAVFIKKRYGYAVYIEDEIINNQQVTLYITEHNSISQIIEKLNYITKLTFKQNANEIRVHK